MTILICTLKSWNIHLAEKLKSESVHNVHIINNSKQLNFAQVKVLEPDFIFFPHWSNYIPEEIYLNFKCVLFHMTDLPFGRGGSPLQNLIVRGYSDTVISAIRVVKEVDAGPVFCKKPLALYGSASEIYLRAAKIIFDQMIPEIIDNDVQPVPQEGNPIFFSRRTVEESELGADMTIDQLYDHIRMLDAEGYPNAFIKFGKYKISFAGAQQAYKSINCKAQIIEEENENE